MSDSQLSIPPEMYKQVPVSSNAVDKKPSVHDDRDAWVYALYDSKADCYGFGNVKFFCSMNDNLAKRVVYLPTLQDGSELRVYAADWHLVRIGSWHMRAGDVIPLDHKVSVCSVQSVIFEMENE